MNLETIFTLSANKLKTALHKEMIACGYTSVVNNKKFLYAEGNAPYMLVAHLDTVHKKLPSIICYSKNGDYMMSPQGIGGDDRCGVYIILELLNKLSFKPYIVFTMEEETGGIGAKAFAKYITEQEQMPELKYIVEFDRKGNQDCVFYQCDNKDFVDFVEKFGFSKAYGTFSDISTIAPAMGVAAVNLSSGYYNPHTEHEYVSMRDVNKIINKSYKMLCTECSNFEYVEAKWDYGSYSYAKGKIKVSFVPANTLYVCSKYSSYIYTNGHHDIAVDQWGNYYKYDKTYGDLMTLYSDIAPIDEEMPMYDEANAVELALYY